MISQLTGHIIHAQGNTIILEVNGVGYDIELPNRCYTVLTQQASRTVTIMTHLSIREDAHLLFGFSDQSTRDAFKRLIKASGIGPKAALAILSQLTVEALIQCIETKDISQLTAIKGIGPKVAQRLMVELKGSFSGISAPILNQHVVQPAPTHALMQANAVLMKLGYRASQITPILKQLSQSDESSTCSSEMLVKQALQHLSSEGVQ